MGKIMYCQKCGEVYHIMISKKCKFCGTKMKLLSKEMRNKYNIFNDDWSSLISKLYMLNTAEGEKKIIEELISRQNTFIMNEVSDNSMFVIEEYENQIEKKKQLYYGIVRNNHDKIRERQAKNLEVMQREKDRQNCIPKCPICGSGNIKKIAFGTRTAKTAMFGTIGAIDDAGKTYSCKNCGSKF